MLFLNSILSHRCPCLFGCSPHFLNHGIVLPLESFLAVPLWPLLFHVPRSHGKFMYQFALFHFPLTPGIQLGHQCPPSDGVLVWLHSVHNKGQLPVSWS